MEKKKSKIHSKYVKLSLSLFTAGTGILLCYYLLYNTQNVANFVGKINDILMPFYIGIVAAYLLCPIYNGVFKYVYAANEGRFEKNIKRYKFARAGATTVSMAFLFCVVGGFFMLVIPELIESIVGLIKDVPHMVETVYDWIDKLLAENPQLSSYVHSLVDENLGNALNWAQDYAVVGAETLISGISLGIIGTFGAIIDIFVALVICVYVLNSKELFQAQAKKFILAMFPEKKASDIFEFGNQVNNTFGGFINGKIIDSIIIGILCFIGMTMLNMPLAVLISVIVGITNIIPFFGPFIGAIPSGILLLFVDPVSALKFAVWILVLQQIDGNIIGPRILGKATKLASFWVMFAILVGGGLFGFIGMVLGVPTMAIIYIYVARMINNKLKKKDMTINTLVYENFDKYKIDKEEVFGKEACDPNEGL